jgi:uncharacterized protein DUF6585
MQMSLDTRFAGVSGLGALLSQHPMSRNGRLGSVFLALVCFAATPLLLGLTAERYDLANNTDSPVFVSTSPWFIYWPAAVGVVLLVSGIWLLFDMARNWKTAAAVYQHGLALNDPAGLRQFRWDAVDEVRQSVTRYYRNGVHTNTVYVYTVRTHDGQTLKFNNRFAKIEELGKAIQSNVSAALLPRYVQALNSGQRLTFGPLAIDRAGLYAGDKSLPWREIEAIKLQDGHIAVKGAADDWYNWAPVSLAQVPNFWVFYEVASNLTRTRAGR